MSKPQARQRNNENATAIRLVDHLTESERDRLKSASLRARPRARERFEFAKLRQLRKAKKGESFR